MLERLRTSKRGVTRLFVGAAAAIGVGLVLGAAALAAALASDAINLGGDHYVDVNGGTGAWIALTLVLVGALVILAGTVAAVLSWIAALLNTWQLEEKTWFTALAALGLLGFGVIAMVAYVVAGPDETQTTEVPAPAPASG
jgi:hypothetical protein